MACSDRRRPVMACLLLPPENQALSHAFRAADPVLLLHIYPPPLRAPPAEISSSPMMLGTRSEEAAGQFICTCAALQMPASSGSLAPGSGMPCCSLPPPPPPLSFSTRSLLFDCTLCFVLQDGGLMMTAESSGVVSTLGWLPEYSPEQCVAHHKARGMSFGARDAANVLPTVFPDRSSANLGGPLVALIPGEDCGSLPAKPVA